MNEANTLAEVIGEENAKRAFPRDPQCPAVHVPAGADWREPPKHARYEGGWYFCWLIERRDHEQPLWFTAGCTWTQNAHEAMWHARKSDADETASDMAPIDVHVCEHGFQLNAGFAPGVEG